MIVYVDNYLGGDVIIRENGILLWNEIDNYKKYLDYPTTSHYYNIKCVLNFIKDIKRKDGALRHF